MENNNQNFNYIKPGVTKEWLSASRFHYNRLLSDEEREVYSYRFPVYKYKEFAALECEISMTPGEKNISIDVYDGGTRNKYAPFYYCEYGNYDKILKHIWNKIHITISKMGIQKRKKGAYPVND